MPIIVTQPRIDSILKAWEYKIGAQYHGYRGHVYRVFNFCLAIRACTREEQDKLAIAACFHDIGLWSDHTVDYLPPSVTQARLYLEAQGLHAWVDEVSMMIDLHHKMRALNEETHPLVETFRQADLVDFSLGLFTFGIPRRFIRSVKKTIPNNGFHIFLLKGAKEWFSQHPFSPPPFMKW